MCDWRIKLHQISQVTDLTTCFGLQGDLWGLQPFIVTSEVLTTGRHYQPDLTFFTAAAHRMNVKKPFSLAFTSDFLTLNTLLTAQVYSKFTIRDIGVILTLSILCVLVLLSFYFEL